MKLIYAYLILLHFQSAISFPIVISPKEFRIKEEEHILLYSNQTDTVNIEVEDFSTKKNILFHSQFNLIQGELTKVPIKIDETSSEKVTLSVINKSGQKRQSMIKLIPKSGHAFIQTDKPIYIPNDQVKIRILKLDKQLKPSEEKIKLRIKNSQRIIVFEKLFQTQGPKYFVDHVFEFPPSPKLGIWTAEVWYGLNFLANNTVSFEVREYVLPTFSVKIQMPKLILPSTKTVNGSVNVEYVYGKPVEGSVTFKFGVKSTSGKITFIGTTSLMPLVNGSASYRFNTNQFQNFGSMTWFPVVNRMKFVVEATVHERVTAKKEKVTSDNCLFVTTPYVISFKNAFHDFKPEIETIVTGQVLDHFGKPVPSLNVSLHMIDERGVHIAAKYITQNEVNSTILLTDHEGIVSFPLVLKDGVERLTVTLRTVDPNYPRDEQAEGVYTIYSYEDTKNYISIKNKISYNSFMTVGQTYETALTMKGNILSDRMYWLVVGQGKIINSGKIDPDGYFRLEITKEMFPAIRIVVFAVKVDDNDIIADSVKIKIQDDICSLDLRASAEGFGGYKPDGKVNFIINGTKGDSVALLGIDEAVYVLRNSERVTKPKVIQELEQLDTGCGSGGGKNTFDVFGNAGLRLIYDESDILDDFSSQCMRSVRVKREAFFALDRYSGRLKRCCLMGTQPTKIRRSCEHKANILKMHLPNDKECYNAFLDCCKSHSTPHVQYSTRVNPFQIKTTTVATFQKTIFEEGGTHVHLAYEEALESQSLIRKDFRETWLFDIILLNESITKYTVTLPHSITTWSITGMSLSKQNGLCLMDSPLRLVSFQPIFLHVSMPYSVVQNEQIEITATIFNYGDIRLNFLLYTYGIENICSEAEPGEKTPRKYLIIDKNSAVSVGFPMVPLKAGEYDIKVVALWSGGGDVVVKKLKVIPPGVTVEDDFTFHLDPLNRQRRKKRSIQTGRLNDNIDPENAKQTTQVLLIPTKNHNTIVPHTQECILSAIGDQYGSSSHNTLSDLNELIRQPKGCGEQTMLYMAPTLYTLKYLQSIDRLNGDTKFKGRKYLIEGYQRELTFRKEDGSFSAFPTRPSSIWLTAFVMKVFCQSQPFLQDDGMDTKVIYSGIEWLLKEQKDDGSWIEKHPVIHERALGGVKGTVPLTAYIAIALNECQNVYHLYDPEFDYALNRSKAFLMKHEHSLIKSKDTYAIGLVAYSLTFKEPKNSHSLISWLHNYSNIDDSKNYKYWRGDYETEATSYALLAILNSGLRNSIEAMSVANYLNSKRSFTGSFYSTQDTVVALEALAKYVQSQSALPENSKLFCNITSNNKRFRKSLEFHKDNALVLQTFKAHNDVDHLEFHTHGNGFGLMSVKLKYNILESPESLCRFDMDIKVKEWKQINPKDIPAQESNDDLFSDFPSDMIEELAFKETKLNFRLKKRRSINWPAGVYFRQALDRVRDRIFQIANYRSNLTTRDLKEQMPNDDPNVNLLNENQQFQLNNLSKDLITEGNLSSLVLIVEICVRYTQRYNSEMSIVDVGLFSGYKPNKKDLDEIISMEGSHVSKYEISDRNIMFYFDEIPHGRPACIQFRVIQVHPVQSIQSAIIKVYDYYKQGHSCTQLYSPSRISQLIVTNCTSDVCQCAKRKNCPRAKSLLEIGIIADEDIRLSREKLKKEVCNSNYQYVQSGEFIQINDTGNGFKLLHFKVDKTFKNDHKDDDVFFWILLNKECDEVEIELNKEFIIFGKIVDQMRTLDGGSIMYKFDEKLREDSSHRNLYSLKLWLEGELIKNGGTICAQ